MHETTPPEPESPEPMPVAPELAEDTTQKPGSGENSMDDVDTSSFQEWKQGVKSGTVLTSWHDYAQMIEKQPEKNFSKKPENPLVAPPKPWPNVSSGKWSKGHKNSFD
jgi:hypothetical protein